MTSELYSDAFFAEIKEWSEGSADHVVPLVVSLVHPSSVVDVGCGSGGFLSAFKKHGVTQVFGVDGPWAKPALDPGEFQSADLTQPLALNRRFDLVVSLEVAEHLDPSSAHVFVRSLAGLGPVVLFSAAIPRQGGTGHVNEQWPDYWATLFAAEGFELVDCLRAKLWDNPDVKWWYAQNAFLYVERTRLAALREERPELREPGALPLRAPHPANYLWQVDSRDREYWSSWSMKRLVNGLRRRASKSPR